MELSDDVPINASISLYLGLNREVGEYQLNSNYVDAVMVPLIIIWLWLEVYY